MPAPLAHAWSRRLLIASVAVLLAASLAPMASAQPVSVTIDPTSVCWCRTTLAGRASPWTTTNFQASFQIGAPSGGGVGQVVIRNLRVTIPSASVLIIIPPTSQVTPHATNLAITVAPVADLAIPGLAGSSGQTLFESPAIPCGLAGVIDYAADVYSCATLQAGGAPCSGVFNLAAPGVPVAASLSAGLVDVSAASGSASLTIRASAPLAPGASWGTVEFWAILHGALSPGSGQSSCPADFNGVGGVTVRDIFDFLAAWFSGLPRADFNHDGVLNVRDIFDFLAAWFAGC